MKKILSLVIAMVAVAALGSPVKSDVGGREDLGIIEETPKNLWVWPTEALARDAAGGVRRPSSIWTPEMGVWYKKMAANGYLFMGAEANEGDFGDDFVTCLYKTGYGWGTFLELEPGHYVIGYKADGAARFWLSFYGEVDDGYQWVSGVGLTKSDKAGHYERVFTVPEGTALTALLPVSPASNEVLTTTDIEIYRLD